MGPLASSSGSFGLFWDPLWVFSLLPPCACSSEVGILLWFSTLADGIAWVLQHQAKPWAYPCCIVRPSCWAECGRRNLSVWLTKSVSSLHTTGSALWAPLWTSWEVSIALGYVTPPSWHPSALTKSPSLNVLCLFCRLLKWGTLAWTQILFSCFLFTFKL